MERWFVRVMVFMFLLSLSKIEVWAFWSGLMLLAYFLPYYSDALGEVTTIKVLPQLFLPVACVSHIR